MRLASTVPSRYGNFRPLSDASRSRNPAPGRGSRPVERDVGDPRGGGPLRLRLGRSAKPGGDDAPALNEPLSSLAPTCAVRRVRLPPQKGGRALGVLNGPA